MNKLVCLQIRGFFVLNIWVEPAIAIGLGYALGSIPFGLVLARIVGKAALRSIGSGNIGATNVLRTGNKPLAFATLILDSGKGAIAVLIAMTLADFNAAMLAGLGALLGHCYPVWLRFKGGKGVATALGCLMGVSLFVFLFCLLIWLVSALVSRISSLSALIATGCAPLAVAVLASPTYIVPTLLMTILILYRHKDNIKRLLDKEEPTIRFRSNER